MKSPIRSCSVSHTFAQGERRIDVRVTAGEMLAHDEVDAAVLTTVHGAHDSLEHRSAADLAEDEGRLPLYGLVGSVLKERPQRVKLRPIDPLDGLAKHVARVRVFVLQAVVPDAEPFDDARVSVLAATLEEVASPPELPKVSVVQFPDKCLY